tara:strand:- start:273 stop:611 length:339 start_codon:yes stop_codon:yes gene_type:complete
MAVYNTSDYSIVSVMKKVKTVGDTATMEAGVLYVQGLPVEDFAGIVASHVDLEEHSLEEADFDNLTRFVDNVIPIFEASYEDDAFNKKDAYTISYTNAAISVDSYYSNATPT